VTGFFGAATATFQLDSHFDVPARAVGDRVRRVPARRVAHLGREGVAVAVRAGHHHRPSTGTVVAPAAETKPGGWYVQVAQRVDDRLQLSAYYSRYFGNRDVRTARSDAYTGLGQGLRGHRRLDLAGHFLLKAEFHRIDGGSRVAAYDNPQGLARKWNLFAAKGTVHF
jgi:hypothetical protein